MPVNTASMSVKGRSIEGMGDLYIFPFTDDDFHRIRQLIYRIAGISLSPSKRDLVYSRLARRLRTLQISTFADYIRLLEQNGAGELVEFINALTTNMTSFFREIHHFPILARHLGSLSGRTPLAVWSCASSSGEEPYSIAMTMVEQFNTFDLPLRILATDIDTKVLAKAREGVYHLDQLQMLTPEQLKRFFLRGTGLHEGFARVRPELQRLITFQRLNLLDEQWGVNDRFDAIFCRNVMIYFDKETQYRILQKMSPRLKSHGLFFAGHSESFHHAADLFRVCGKTVYAPLH